MKIPIHIIIGFAADNASVIMGPFNSLKSRFLQIQPNIFALGCVCHSFNLCSNAACQKLPKSLEEFVRDIHNYFANSAKSQAEFKDSNSFVRVTSTKYWD